MGSACLAASPLAQPGERVGMKRQLLKGDG
jgi:hypothetical protein